MKEYHKIETIFQRDLEGTKKLIENKFRNPTIEYLKDNKWVFSEKIDGMNIRIHWDGHKVTFAGRTDATQLPRDLVQALNNKFGGLVNEQLFEQKFSAIPVTLYGEGYGEGIQSGGNYRKGKGFALFDVFIGGLWLKRDAIEDIAKAFDVPVTPIVFVGTIAEAIAYVKTNPNCTFAQEEKKAEGLIGRPAIEMFDRRGNRIIIKIKACDF